MRVFSLSVTQPPRKYNLFEWHIRQAVPRNWKGAELLPVLYNYFPHGKRRCDMLNELAPILAFMARSKDTQLNKDISYFLYKKQHEIMGV